MAKQVVVRLENHFQNGNQPNRKEAEEKLYLCIKKEAAHNA